MFFDPLCATEQNCDYIQLKSAGGIQVGPEKYTGRAGTGNNNYAYEASPLLVDGDSLTVRFYSDGSNTDWGIKLTASATCITTSMAGDPSISSSRIAVAELKARTVFVLSSLLRRRELVPRLLSLAKPLMAVATTALSSGTYRPAGKSAVYESKHPVRRCALRF